MYKRYAIFAATAIILILLIYVINFGFQSDYSISKDPSSWGPFGDYVGGILNPILSFTSIMLLIHSLQLQHEENKDLREELRNSERTEKMRSFSALFFNMISSQKALFNSFSIIFSVGGTLKVERNASAVLVIEEEIERLRAAGADDKRITAFLEQLDSNDSIFGILRAFYITVKIISDKLNSENKFSYEDRQSQLLTLINFTDFAQLRLVLIAAQFLQYPAANYLRTNEEFQAVLLEVGLGPNLY